MCKKHKKVKEVLSGSTTINPLFYSLQDLIILLGISKGTIYGQIRKGNFPKGRRLGADETGRVGWLIEDIKKWTAELPEVTLPEVKAKVPPEEKAAGRPEVTL